MNVDARGTQKDIIMEAMGIYRQYQTEGCGDHGEQKLEFDACRAAYGMIGAANQIGGSIGAEAAQGYLSGDTGKTRIIEQGD